ncbi:MAG: acyl-CoA/acyl-ACP dehydrogenase [Azospirillaceae bacterium]|nr:acyl-CoA/acyl-ACP dehydrogenase [Azospirillaceae bacterium]
MSDQARSPTPPFLVRHETPGDAVLTRLSADFAAGAAELDRSGTFPFANIATLHRHGLISQVAPVALGGAGADLASARRIITAVARGEPATALILAMTWLQHRQFARPGCRWPSALQAEIVHSAITDGALINTLRVEPELGSPARGGLPATLASRHGDRWRLRGRKLYSTGCPGLRWLVVWARTDEPEPRVGNFLVPRSGPDTPGIRIVESWNHLGLRASASHDVILDDVEIPLDHAVDIRAPGAWATAAASQIDSDGNADQQTWMIVLLGSLYDAIAQTARDWLVGFLRHRSPTSLGAPLATLPRVQEALGEIEALLHTNRVLLDHPTGEPGLIKYTVMANAIRAVERALHLTGNHGLSRVNPLERHYRDVLCGRIHTPQDDTILINAGRAALGPAALPPASTGAPESLKP